MKPSATASECSFSGAGGSVDVDHAPSPNLYRDLMQKYEAVLEVQRQAIPRSRMLGISQLVTITSIPPVEQQQQQQPNEDGSPANNCIEGNAQLPNNNSVASTASVHDSTATLSSPPMTSSNNTSSGATSSNNQRAGSRADFSEAETSSSGFADETSNKYTQTEETLCFSLDAAGDVAAANAAAATANNDAADDSVMSGRFQSQPEYRDLFKEIFAILKKAADNKDAGEALPLLDADDDDDDEDTVTNTAAADAEAHLQQQQLLQAGSALAQAMYCDDNESVVSSVMSEQSVAMSERITRQERRTVMETVMKHCEKQQQHNAAAAAAAAVAAAANNTAAVVVDGQENIQPSTAASSQSATTTSQPTTTANSATGSLVDKDGRILTPFKRDTLEYLSISVNARKKSRRKSRTNSTSSGSSQQQLAAASDHRSELPMVLPSPPRVYYSSSGKKRRDMRSTTIASAAAAVEAARLQQMLVANGASKQTAATAAFGGMGSAATQQQVRSPNIKWDGTSMTLHNRNQVVAGGSGAMMAMQPTDGGAAGTSSGARRVDFKRTSAASQSLHKLFELDLSYAEVLRRADSSKMMQNMQQQKQQQHLLLQQQQQQQRHPQRKY